MKITKLILCLVGFFCCGQIAAEDITSVRDTLITNDSIIVIHTVCAPICSSHARVYNKEWQLMGELQAPFTSIFPEAYIEDGQLLWRDNDTLDYTPCF
mgnify:CR=1 FL=1